MAYFHIAKTEDDSQSVKPIDKNDTNNVTV